MNAAKAKMAAEEATRNAKLEQNFARQNKEADQRAAIIRKEATASLIPVAAGAAALMAEKLIGSKVDSGHALEVASQISKSITAK